MKRERREPSRRLRGRCLATERAIHIAIFRWHIAGCLKQLREAA